MKIEIKFLFKYIICFGVILIVVGAYIPIRYLTHGWSMYVYYPSSNPRWAYGLVWPTYTILFVLATQITFVKLSFRRWFRLIAPFLLWMVWMHLWLIDPYDGKVIGLNIKTGAAHVGELTVSEVSVMACQILFFATFIIIEAIVLLRENSREKSKV